MGVIDDIRQRVDLVEVVSEYVPLQKAGRSYRALCPFHTEKHPSFFVFPDQQSWHCFGSCSTGGDVFSFLMRKENLDFSEALRLLSEKTGVPLAPKPQHEAAEKGRLFQLNKIAAEYYQQLLHSPAGEEAQNYLAGRGISPESITEFQLGFSPNGWQALQHHLTQIGYEEKDLVRAGLTVEGEGGSYDRFRNRLMFPISDPQGKVVGFGARALDDSLPKYLNSPQTMTFDKSSILYGIDLAKKAIRGQDMAVVVEGYTDVITAHQYGFTNVVASMGTALAEKQVDILKRLTKNIVLAFDADAAGEEATWRGVVRYENTLDAEVRVIILPPGKDPDDILREDAAAWQELTSKALPAVDFIFNAVSSKLDLTQAGDKSSAVEQLLPLVVEMKDLVRQSHYLQKLTRLVGVDERVLEAQLRRLQPSKRRRVGPGGQQLPTLQPTLSSPLEEYCLALLLQHPEFKEGTRGLLPDYFAESKNRQLFIAWQQATDPVSLGSGLDPALQEHLDSILARVLPPIGCPEYALTDGILRLREKFLRSLKAKERDLILGEGQDAEVARLQIQAIEVNEQLREVFVERGGQQRLPSNEGG